MTCNCYVSTLAPHAQFTLRYGSHETTCPVYRESKDPVDRKQDEEYRRFTMGQARSPRGWSHAG